MDKEFHQIMNEYSNLLIKEGKDIKDIINNDKYNGLEKRIKVLFVMTTTRIERDKVMEKIAE